MRLRFTIRRMMGWAAIAALALLPPCRYINSSPRGRVWWERAGRLCGGIVLCFLVVTGPYIAGFWKEIRSRRAAGEELSK